MTMATDFEVESYLDHQAAVFLERFDALSYLYLSRVMDYFTPFEEEGVDLDPVGTRFLVVSFDTDWRFGTEHSAHIAARLAAGGVDVRHHDVRYTMGAIVFVAVLGTAWVVRLSPRRQALATVLLLGAVTLAQLGATFGVARDPGQLPLSNGAIGQGEGVPPRDSVVVYSSLDYLVSGPLRDGDVPGLMRRLRADGVDRVATEDRGDVDDHMFETVGLIVLARAAALRFDGVDPPQDGDELAQLIRASDYGDGTPPCARLFNGTGVWVRIGDRLACPS